MCDLFKYVFISYLVYVLTSDHMTASEHLESFLLSIWTDTANRTEKINVIYSSVTIFRKFSFQQFDLDIVIQRKLINIKNVNKIILVDLRASYNIPVIWNRKNNVNRTWNLSNLDSFFHEEHDSSPHHRQCMPSS